MASKVSRHFKPSVSGTVALFLLATLFANMGLWQTRRAAEKSETEQLHQAAVKIPFEDALANGKRFARIEISGYYDPDRHILLDNQVWNGRAGVHVFTPFYALDGTAILVNRGWLPLAANRRSLPDIATPEHQTVVRGMLNILPVPGRMLGQSDDLKQNQWPQLITYLNIKDITESIDAPLQEWVIQLSPDENHGFEGRDWKPVFLSSKRHKGYAFQWFALTAACIVLWLIIGFRRSPGTPK